MAAAPGGYRPDIDGLRAIAVLSVVVFHFAHGYLPGGYRGVDIFFVLSGYLITQVIHGEILARRFSLRAFYERRVRRIVPALLALLAFSSVVAVLILLPSDLVGFAKALLATLAFGANIYAWRDTNYFSPLADEKPLLHTWSLGVEEQFYILFPLMLWLLVRRWPRLTVPALVAFSAGSLALDALAQQSGASTAAFFLLPTRAWELGVGAIAALVPRRAPGATKRAMRSLVAVLALGAIAIGLCAPGLVLLSIAGTVLTVAGTAALLRTGQQDGPVSRLLGFAPLVWTGLISYSLYLWHWPLLVYAKYFLIRELQPLEVMGLWLLMFAAAALSWRFVERPFRRREFPARRLYLGAALGTVVLAALGVALLQARGLPRRLNAEAAIINAAVGTHFRCSLGDRIKISAMPDCALNLPSHDPADARLVLLGNSHATMYAPVWRDLLEQRAEGGLLIPIVGCLPTLSANLNVGCMRQAQAGVDAINELPNVHTVVLAMTWRHGASELVDLAGRPLDNRGMRAQIAALDELIARLQARGRRIVLVGPIATPEWNMASVVSRQLAYGRRVDRPLSEPRETFAREFAPVFSHFSGRADVTLARPDLVQCDAAVCRYMIDGRPLLSDSNHLASAEVGLFRDIFAAALGR